MEIGTVDDTDPASSSAHDREWVRLKELQQAVLLHLTERGSTKWGALYSHFDDDGTGKIGEALAFLVQRQQITVEADGTAKITPSGAERLKSRAARPIDIKAAKVDSTARSTENQRPRVPLLF